MELNLTDINRGLIQEEVRVNGINLEEIKNTIKQEIDRTREVSKIYDGYNYYAAMCVEKYDFTIFKIVDTDKAVDEIIAVVGERGRILLAEKETHCANLWVEVDGFVYRYKIFNYDMGVVEC